MPPEEFPSEPEIADHKLYPIDANFFDLLGKVKYAASKEDNRYNINGVFIGADIVATDGHRMAVIKKNLGLDNIIIPLDFVNIILKARNRKDGNTLQAGCSNNIFFLKTKDLILFGRLIDGEFPDYSQVIPNDSLRYASIPRKILSQAIKRIMLMSGKHYQMKFEFKARSLSLSSATPDLGDATEEMEIEFRSEMGEDKPFAMGINGKYLLDMLEVLESERVTIGMENEVSPVKVDEADSIHILMPLRLVESEPRIEPETQPEPDSDSESEFIEEGIE
jgi:DNA polymerase-3 subunit beta